MGSSICRALRHSGGGDEPRMASQAGSAVSEILDLADIPRGKAITKHPVLLGGLFRPSMTISNVYTKAIDASFADGLKAGSDYVSLVRIRFKSSALRNSAAV